MSGFESTRPTQIVRLSATLRVGDELIVLDLPLTHDMLYAYPLLDQLNSWKKDVTIGRVSKMNSPRRRRAEQSFPLAQ